MPSQSFSLRASRSSMMVLALFVVSGCSVFRKPIERHYSPEEVIAALDTAHNQVLRVAELEYHVDPDGHGYYTFLFDPSLPYEHITAGRVEACDVVGTGSVSAAGPDDEATTLMIVRHGSISPVRQEIVTIGSH